MIDRDLLRVPHRSGRSPDVGRMRQMWDACICVVHPSERGRLHGPARHGWQPSFTSTVPTRAVSAIARYSFAAYPGEDGTDCGGGCRGVAAGAHAYGSSARSPASVGHRPIRNWNHPRPVVK